MTVRDQTLRRELAQNLRWLVGGRITTDQFDDFLFGSGCLRSWDRAVAEIADWAWTLYSDAEPVCLRDRRRPTDEVLAAARRAVVLLRSNADYEWPRPEGQTLAAVLDLTRAVGWLGAVATAIVAALAWVNNVVWVGAVMLGPKLFGVAMGLAKVAIGANHLHRQLSRKIAADWAAAGEAEAWPFLSQQHLADAATRGRLLAGPG